MVEPKETNKNPPELPIERFPLAVGAGPQTAFQQEAKMRRGSFRDFRYFRGSYTTGSLLEETQSDSRAQNQLTECAHDCCCDCRTVILEPTKWSVRLTIRVFRGFRGQTLRNACIRAYTQQFRLQQPSQYSPFPGT